MRNDITGRRFGRLVAVKPVGLTKARNTIWLFNCDCGGTTEATRDTASRPNAGCGCMLGKAKKHGYRPRGAKTPEYTSWQSMKARCLNPKHVAYASYGGSGITIDPKWIVSFESFLSDVGPCPVGCNSIDRIDPHGNYAKENVRWSNPKQQGLNRRNTVMTTIDGHEVPVMTASKALGIKYTTARNRVLSGKPITGQ